MGEVAVRALSLISIVAIGLIIKKLGWVSIDDFPMFSRIVLQVTLPCALVTSFDRFEISSSLLFLTALGLVVNLIGQVAGYLVSRSGSRMDKSFAVMSTGSYNIGVFATPYLSTLLGPGAAVHTSMFDIGNSAAAAGVSYGWGLTLAGRRTREGVLGFVLEMFRSPVFDVYLFLLAFRGLGLHFPQPVLAFTATVGAANPFMAMLMIGVGLEPRLSRHKYARAAQLLGLRYAISTLAALVIWNWVPMDRQQAAIVCMLLYAPLATMVPGFVSEAGGDVELSTFMSTVTILVAMVMMPTVWFALQG